MKFGVSTKKPNKSDFYTNSNFFTNKSAIGLVVVNGKKINSKTIGGGYFYVTNGVAHVSSKKCPKNVDFASQTILWGIDNGVKNKKLFKTSHGKLKRYRTIIGENNNGEIMIISSDRLGLVTIKEIIDFAYNKGMNEGILLDGGTSVDYKFSDDKNSVCFESVPSDLKPLFKIKKPTTYIYGNLN
jgi:exopolysaccharide biosynthesis protein